MKKSNIIILFALICMPFLLVGQVTVKSMHLRKIKDTGNIPLIILPGSESFAGKHNFNNNHSKSKVLKFAEIIDVDISPTREGKCFEDEKGNKTWILKIKSPGAYSLGLLFDNYRLPIGAELNIYNTSHTHFKGALTYINNKWNNILAVTPIKGDEIIIDYYEPFEIQFNGELHIASVAHDYLNIFNYLEKEEKGFGDSGTCNVNINCDGSELWQLIKHSVSKIIYNGYLCSGALINNTRNDGHPYYLTANHCIDNSFDASAAIFYFNYESPDCSNINGPTGQSISGSKLIATPSIKSLDFSLLELSVQPPASYFPYYAGWNRDVSDPESVTSIHHPRGDIKKITKSFDGATTNDYGEGYTPYSHWWIDEWSTGTTEGGSSGSPLFNQDGLIIGDLTGGDASCSYNFNDYYQQLHWSWDTYQDTLKQLKYWLDPENTGELMLEGYQPYDTFPTHLNAKLNVSGIDLNWHELINSSDVVQYYIYRDSVKLDSTDQKSYTDNLVYKDSVYLYWVTALLNGSEKRETKKSNQIFVNYSDTLLLPFKEDFESADKLPAGWYQEKSKGASWEFKQGGYSGIIDTAYEGLRNAYYKNSEGETAKLVLPRLNLSSHSHLILSFYLLMPSIYNQNHHLKILYKQTDSIDWKTLKVYESGIEAWNQKNIVLPDLSENYQIAFEGIGLGGAGICIDSITIVIDGKYIEPNIIANKTEICIYDSIEYTSSIEDTNTITWDFGMKAVPRYATGKGPHIIKYLDDGIQPAKITVNDKYEKYITDIAKVYDIPKADFTIENGKLKSNFTYGNQWYFNGVLIKDATSQYFTPTEKGYYQVVVTNSYGCEGASPEKYVITNDMEDVPVPEDKSEQFKIFPNPANSFITLVIPEGYNFNGVSLRIIDASGMILKKIEINPFESEANVYLNGMPEGIYILQLNNKKQTYTTKIIIKK